MPKETKADAAHVEMRVNKIFDLLLLGLSRAEMLQYVAEQTDWGIEERQVDNYIKAATTRLKKLSKFHRQTELGRGIARLHSLYMALMKVQDYKGALTVQKELNELLGLYAPKKVDLTSDGKPLPIAILKMDVNEL